ncbi:hypothetical protein [Sphingomonas mesophila]|uniref:hypothetical protein n=1 Tax=Sphingomonas mesophila TaxID=2303576 RepID=UPI000E578F8F|nr:hypothetical protein [Sphingomonas mesophila]
MSAALRAGAAYFVAAFALGSVLGTVRVVLLEQAFGPWTAVAIELPVMLAASWWLCGWAIRRWRVPWGASPRAAMGALAFALLIAAEIALGIGLFGRSLGEQIGEMTAGTGLAGLISQLAFALFPLVRHRDKTDTPG